MQKLGKVYVAGHRGMVGSAIIRKLQSEGFNKYRNAEHLEALDLKNSRAKLRNFLWRKNRTMFFWRQQRLEVL